MRLLSPLSSDNNNLANERASQSQKKAGGLLVDLRLAQSVATRSFVISMQRNENFNEQVFQSKWVHSAQQLPPLPPALCLNQRNIRIRRCGRARTECGQNPATYPLELRITTCHPWKQPAVKQSQVQVARQPMGYHSFIQSKGKALDHQGFTQIHC